MFYKVLIIYYNIIKGAQNDTGRPKYINICF